MRVLLDQFYRVRESTAALDSARSPFSTKIVAAFSLYLQYM